MAIDWIGRIGRYAIELLQGLRFILAAVLATVITGSNPRTWSALTRRSLARQIVVVGVEALGLTVSAALLTGVSVVVQSQLWLRRVGQTQLLGPFLGAVIVRELGPILANLIVIARGGSSMVVELGGMRASGQVGVLDAIGVDRFRYLVVPRSVAMSISVFCLTIVFVVVSLGSGYAFASLRGAVALNPRGFLTDVTQSISPTDVLNVLAKSFIPGLLSGVICCSKALVVGRGADDVRRASALAVQQSIFALFVVSSIVSILTYL